MKLMRVQSIHTDLITFLFDLLKSLFAPWFLAGKPWYYRCNVIFDDFSSRS